MIHQVLRGVRPALRALRLVTIAVCVVWLTTPPTWAQSVSSSSINGTVKDETGAVLPGVVVTLTSPALQVPEMTAVSDSAGAYRFVDLPAGVYSLKAVLDGFSTLLHNDLRLTVGFVARIDLPMKVSQFAETLTISGQAPVVDMTTTSHGVALTKEVLDAAPRGRGLFEVFYMAPGVTGAERPDVGDSQLADRQNIEAYGTAAQPTMIVDGLNITTSGDSSSAVYMTSFGFEEVQVRSSGNDAEVGTPGISMVAVLKSGSNDFHGTFAGAFQRPRMQSSNLTDELRAQGLRTSEPLRYYYDAGADLGGPLVQNKLWFYTSWSEQKRISGLIGFAAGPGPDGRYLTEDDVPSDYESSLWSGVMKGSYQATAKHRLSASWTPGKKFLSQSGGTRLRPLENTAVKDQPILGARGELQSTFAARLLFNAVVGYNGYQADDNVAQAGFLRPEFPSRIDRETGLRTGPAELGRLVPSRRKETNASVSYFPERNLGGTHELKAGTALYWESSGVGRESLNNGNYLLTFDRVNGVSGQPVEIKINNSPVLPKNVANVQSVFVKDTWRINNQLTANVGVRWQRDHAFLPTQTKETSPLFPSLFPGAEFQKLDVLTWNAIMPRAGIAWSLGPRSVVKSTYGTFVDTIGANFGAIYNPNAEGSAVFRWRDLNGNGNYNPGEVNLDPNGLDFISITAASTNVLNPDLDQPKTTEMTASFEHELMTNLGFRSQYIYKTKSDTYGNAAIRRPYSAYNIPITRRDPGPDSVLGNSDDGGRITVYDYDAAYRGAAFSTTQRVNSENSDSWNSMEFTLTKRAANQWTALASFWMIKNDVWITPVVQSPNDDIFPKDETWSWAMTSNANYWLPGNVMVAAFFQARAGNPGARTYIIRAADPDGGMPLRQLSTVTARVEPFGATRTPAIKLANVKASKRFSLGRGSRLDAEFEVFNVFNTGTPTDVTFASGPTYGYATAIVPARVARLGVRFGF